MERDVVHFFYNDHLKLHRLAKGCVVDCYVIWIFRRDSFIILRQMQFCGLGKETKWAYTFEY